MTDDTKKQWRNRYWGGQKPPEAKHDFFDAITTPAPSGDGTVATIRMYGPIDSWGGWWGISAKDVSDVLDALPSTVEQIILRINSPGGQVFEAVSILNMFRAHKASVIAVVDGLAASAASVIAAGCDETVMSPGTQMMIHAPLVFMYGNAKELRKEADILDGIQASIVEIYTAKAGEKNWAELLDDDTFLTAQQTVDLGLADRIAVIPDAGEAATVGADDDLVVIHVDPTEDDDEADDLAAARVTRLTGAAAAAAIHRPPSSTEPGDPNRKDEAVAYSDLQAGLRERLGVTDADASDDTLLAAVDQALAETADTPTAAAVIETLPEGVTMIDSAVLDELRAQAAQGAEARQEQTRTRRDGILAAAIADGRIAPASRDQWAALLDDNEAGTVQLLDSLPKNTTVPVRELGHSDSLTSTDDALYAKAWGDSEEEA